MMAINEKNKKQFLKNANKQISEHMKPAICWSVALLIFVIFNVVLGVYEYALPSSWGIAYVAGWGMSVYFAAHHLFPLLAAAGLKRRLKEANPPCD